MNKLLILLALTFSITAQASPVNTPGAKYTVVASTPGDSVVTAKKGRVTLTGISAVHNNSRVMLEWKVRENEAGNYFEIESSADGVRFRTEAMVFFSEVVGQDLYRFKCSSTKLAYRIKIVNKDGSESFSRAFTIEQ